MTALMSADDAAPAAGAPFALLVAEGLGKQVALPSGPLTILAAYAAVGALIYAAYGYWHSKLAKGIDITEDTALASPAEALGGKVDNVKED